MYAPKRWKEAQTNIYNVRMGEASSGAGIVGEQKKKK